MSTATLNYTIPADPSGTPPNTQIDVAVTLTLSDTLNADGSQTITGAVGTYKLTDNLGSTTTYNITGVSSADINPTYTYPINEFWPAGNPTSDPNFHGKLVGDNGITFVTTDPNADGVEYSGVDPSNEVNFFYTPSNGGYYAQDTSSAGGSVEPHAINVTAACYCQGTRIRTARGEVGVEDLAIGDEVVTASGALRRIKWIGRRTYGGRFILGRKDILPICFKAGSLGDGVPVRDLYVSPTHAMFVEGVLIPASALVDGIGVTQLERVERVDYFHVELDTHDLLLAEGAPAESYLEDDSRGMFVNAAEYERLYPGEGRASARFCAPRREDGPEVERARRAIAARAGALRAA